MTLPCQVFKQADFLPSGGAVRYGFYGRGGGGSTGLYTGLNCGLGSGDDAQAVLDNRARVAHDLGLGGAEDLFAPYQVHGADCVQACQFGGAADRPAADACVTDKPGAGLSIVTADCAPVLFYASRRGQGGVIGAAHAGWKGAVGGVLEAVIDAMVQDYGVMLEDIRACVGPCIAQKSYEVDQGFYDAFLKCSADYEGFFIAGAAAGKYQFDLEGFCQHRLRAAGLLHVYGTGLDTYTAEEDFFSYRRATHRGQGDYGRQISAICLAG